MPWKLLWRNLVGHPVRSFLTFGSVTVAVFLVSMLHAISAGLSRTLDAAAANRLLVQSAVSLFVDLPLSYQQKMAAVPGIEAICKWQWFGGRYEQDKGGFFAQFAIDPATFFVSYPEMHLVEGNYDDFVKTRTACIVGRATAAKYGWRVGQTVPIMGTIFTRTDGQPWQFTIAGLYASKSLAIDEQTMYFHYDYLRESLEQGGAVGPQGVGVYMLRLAPGTAPVTVQQTVDTLFENGPQRVRTMTEAEFNRQFISMLGDLVDLLPLIGGAVVFAIFFAVLNTMLMAARERTRDVGILKALGFADGVIGGLLLLESLLLCVAGGALGALLALAANQPLWSVMSTMIPGFAIDPRVVFEGLALATVLGVLAGVLPAWRNQRLRPVTALRMEV
jgi:putative ABC transport system permease protein